MRTVGCFLLPYILSMAVYAQIPSHVYYEPYHVALEGVVKTLTFAGRPNYESIADGDEPETCPYLVLSKAIDVVPPKGSEELPEQHVQLIQLVVMRNRHWQHLKEGDRVRVEGTLFHALTGHHHARVLLEVQQVTVLARHQKSPQLTLLSLEDQEFLATQSMQ